jgi:hypothetical protein
MVNHMVQRLWLVVFAFGAALISGCFSPEFRDNAIMCGPNGECPPDMSCVNLVCRSGGLTQDATTFYTLTVNKGGDGAGTVSSAPTGIDCGADCTEEVASGTMVTLTATPGTDSVFVGWTGACSGTQTCTITLNAATSVTAMFALQYSLVVALGGNGSGFVTSQPSGINCGADCTEGYTPNTIVALSGFAATGSTFDGWSGPGAANCTSNAPCNVTIDQAKMITATFTLQKHTLTIVPAGNGTGTVAASGGGIDCGADCTEAYDYNSTVTLTPTAATGSTFGGWSGGGCTGTNPCMVTMTAATSVTATWNLTTVALTVDKQGNGSGTVSSAPAGINCGSTCNTTFNYNTSVTLSATPTAGSVFSGWSGGSGNATACSGTGSCIVPLTQASMVTATFALTTPTLTAAKAGNGSGTVTSGSGGINCGQDCTENPNFGSVVTLTAVATTGSTFAGWTGGNPTCTGLGTCMTTIDGAQTITATFTLDTHDLDVIVNTGTGAGTVTGPNINCGQGNTDCAETYNYNASVSLTATPAPGSVFTSWSGGGCSGNGGCSPDMTADQTVTAVFTLTTHALTLANGGTGSGKVTSLDTNLDCGSDCVHVYPYNSSVTLTAAPDPGSTFLNWTNGCGTTNPCLQTITTAKTVTANFAISQYQLTVTKNSQGGNGGGTVVANVGALNCGGDCNDMYNYNTVVTLTATPNANASFTGWTGGLCTGTGDCVVTMSQARSVNAEFQLGASAFTVSKPGTGSGTVTSSNPANYIDCGLDCSENPVPDGTQVTLVAVASTGSTFQGWSVAGSASTCPGTGNCVVTTSSSTPTNVAANFQINTYNLTVMGTGNGRGVINSSPGNISCGVGGATGSDCVDPFTHGQVVQLTATPEVSTDFTGWSGGGCSGVGVCNVTMDMATMVVATFTKKTFSVNVRPQGRGTGLVDADIGDINCGAVCDDVYNYGDVVTLTATPDVGSDFDQWSGVTCTSGSGNVCGFTVTSDVGVYADFIVEQHTISVTLAGPAGGGSVTATEPNGIIDCPGDCSELVDYNTHVTIKPSAAYGYDFVGWSGGGANCSGNGNCDVDVTAATNVTATFAVSTYLLTVTTPGNGSGSVSSSPAGITCATGNPGGNDCTQTYNHDTNVQLTATPTPNTGTVFAGWSANTGCTIANNPCTVDMLSALTVSATFSLTQHTLTVQKAGPGNGNIVSVPNGTINCPNAGGTPDCSETNVNYGTTITLAANPATGSSFSPGTGWTGCTSINVMGQCVVTITANTTVQATFAVIPPNYVFITSTAYNGALSFNTLTGLAAADAICNDRAAASAVIPDADANITYKAYLSRSASGGAATARLAGSSGWIRHDGKPVFNTIADIQSGKMMYPIKFDEAGTAVAETVPVMTGTNTSGTYASAGGECGTATAPYTLNQGLVAGGVPNANSDLFSYDGTPSCALNTLRLYCFGVGRAAVVTPTTGPFRRAFTTNDTFTPVAAPASPNGIAAADAFCQAQSGSLGGTWKALLATTTGSAISRFTTASGAPWARPDNTLLTNTAAEMAAAMSHLLAAPNGNAQQTDWYGFTETIFTGAVDLTTIGTVATTCNNWTDTAGTSRVGYAGHTAMSKWFGFGSGNTCTGKRIVCMQQ